MNSTPTAVSVSLLGQDSNLAAHGFPPSGELTGLVVSALVRIRV